MLTYLPENVARMDDQTAEFTDVLEVQRASIEYSKVLSLSPIGRSCEADLLGVIVKDDPRTAIRILSVDYIFLR
jgi:hypothetical protein